MISPTICERKEVYIPEAPCGCEFYMVLLDTNDTSSYYNLYANDGTLVKPGIEVANDLCSKQTVTVPVVEDVDTQDTASGK